MKVAKRAGDDRPIGLVFPDGRVTGEWGTCAIDETPKPAALYAWTDVGMRSLARRLNGAIRYAGQRGRIAEYRLAGRKVYALREMLAGRTREEAFEILRAWAGWIRSSGAHPSSLSASSWNIWRAQLPRSRRVASRHRFPIEQFDVMLGSRQESAPGIYENVVLWDIHQAYPAAMRTLVVPARYIETRTVAIGETGFALATVRFPRRRPVYGPLPCRNGRHGVTFHTEGTVEGVWDLHELEIAAGHGCEIAIEKAWVGRSKSRPFMRWADLMAEGRALAGPERLLAKATANSLWGAFAARGRSTWVRFDNGIEIIERDRKDRTPPALALAAHVAARVRGRLFSEALAPVGILALGAHTDGVLLSSSVAPAGLRGIGQGRWDRRAVCARLELLDAQLYRWVDLEGREHHVISGTPVANAADRWERVVSNNARRRRVDRAWSPRVGEIAWRRRTAGLR